jgi:hypothetical protein
MAENSCCVVQHNLPGTNTIAPEAPKPATGFRSCHQVQGLLGTAGKTQHQSTGQHNGRFAQPTPSYYGVLFDWY